MPILHRLRAKPETMKPTVAPAVQAQGPAQAQKLAVLAKQLNLTPAQKTQLMPILEADAPKLEAMGVPLADEVVGRVTEET